MSRAHQSPEQRFNASLGHHLGRMIDASDTPVREYATGAGIPERRLRAILAGSIAISLPDLARLCTVLGVKPSTLLESARL